MLFAVNVTAVIPATPANVGVFQAACVAVLSGAYHVSTPDAIAYGIVLQAVEVATALIMGLPALLNEGLSWREVRLRTMHATPGAAAAPPRHGRRGRRARLREGTQRRARSSCRGDGARPGSTCCAARDGSLYTGWSTDVQRRLASHRAGRASRYTASRLPVELVLARAMADRSAAMREEARIKRLDRAGEARADRRRGGRGLAGAVTPLEGEAAASPARLRRRGAA